MMDQDQNPKPEASTTSSSTSINRITTKPTSKCLIVTPEALSKLGLEDNIGDVLGNNLNKNDDQHEEVKSQTNAKITEPSSSLQEVSQAPVGEASTKSILETSTTLSGPEVSISASNSEASNALSNSTVQPNAERLTTLSNSEVLTTSLNSEAAIPSSKLKTPEPKSLSTTFDPGSRITFSNLEASLADPEVSSSSPRDNKTKTFKVTKAKEEENSKTPGDVDIETSRRSGRKRKAVDYAQLCEGTASENTSNVPKTELTETPTHVKRKRGRPRKTKADEVDSPIESDKIRKDDGLPVDHSPVCDALEPESSSSTPELELKKTETPIPPKRRPGRPRKIRAYELKEIDQKDVSVPVASTPSELNKAEVAAEPTKKKGRKGDNVIGSITDRFLNIIATCSLFTRTFLDHNESEKEDLDQSSTGVVCAICKKDVSKSNWAFHKLRYHNNLAWKLGDRPLDLNDRSLVVGILNGLQKKKQALHCPVCDSSKKSALGFLSHLAMCNKSGQEIELMKMKCKYCDALVLPASLPYHLSTCNQNENRKIVKEEKEKSISDEDPSGKRKAAVKAMGIINNLKEDENIVVVTQQWTKRNKMLRTVGKYLSPAVVKHLKNAINNKGKITCPFESCAFEATTIDVLLGHVKNCDKVAEQGAYCKRCVKIYKNPKIHVSKNHKNEADTEDEYEDNGEEHEDDGEEELDNGLTETEGVIKQRKIQFDPVTHVQFIVKHRYCPVSSPVLYRPAYEWTLKFCSSNYSQSNLFASLKLNETDLIKLDPRVILSYLPCLKYSACVARITTNKFTDPQTKDHTWRRYKLFEADISSDGNSTIFCGAPILSISWLPTPYDQDNCDQIVAVSVGSGMNSEFRLNKIYLGPQLIQFWNCGLLKSEASVPKLEFCIAHDYGIAWCLEWCPSGCYDRSDQDSSRPRRLGLLAVGCTNSYVYVYAICKTEQDFKILKPKPVLKLGIEVEVLNKKRCHATKMSWSKSSGHRFLAVGYGNGLVAIFDLETTSSLLRKGCDSDGVETLLPYKTFIAHSHAVTAISLYHLNNGQRWLMTASIDHSVSVWDLENISIPLRMSSKYSLVDGVWLNHWLCSVCSMDDCYAADLTPTTTFPLRNFHSDPANINYCNSKVNSISGSEWTNGFIEGTDAGEINGVFLHQMLCGLDNEKARKLKRTILGYARIVEKNVSVEERIRNEKAWVENRNAKSIEMNIREPLEVIKKMKECSHLLKNEPIEYEEAQDKYGLVFCDIKMSSMKQFVSVRESYNSAHNKDKYYPSRPNVYPLHGVNKVAINPNRKSFSWLATGYQAGFVRITNLNFLNT